MAKFGQRYWLPIVLTIAGTFAWSNELRATTDGPLVTSGRWIKDASGAIVTYVGANWPGSLDTMIPEGLQYQSVDAIVLRMAGLGMNAIRLTYATEMIDQYYENGQTDVTVQKALTDVLGQDDGNAVLQKILTNNPTFNDTTTRLQVYDAIAESVARHGMYLHLDNHISKAGWCCSPLDGNAWWGDQYFDVANWTRGLSFMATHGKSWSNLKSMSLRNELRSPLSNFTFASENYNWQNWYKFVKEGADAIHSANEDLLIFLSGLNSDQDLSVVVDGTALTPGSATFNADDFAGYADKLVLELHAYDNIFGPGPSDCSTVGNELSNDGFMALTSDAKTEFPVVLTEFGLEQNGTAAQDPYVNCLLNYTSTKNAGWMIWQIGGSYYIREGVQDRDESWGLLAHDWSDWRASDFVNNTLTPAIKSTLNINPDSISSAGTSDKKSESTNTKSLSLRLGAAILAFGLTFVLY
ncbi:glycoside hydrolase [Rostrohypoxylon terebratum]|nr:glycoside hydrolase [Rostrohypoxylon terebratum]